MKVHAVLIQRSTHIIVHNFTNADTLAHTIQQSYMHCTLVCASLVKQSVAYTDCPDLCDRWGYSA